MGWRTTAGKARESPVLIVLSTCLTWIQFRPLYKDYSASTALSSPWGGSYGSTKLSIAAGAHNVDWTVLAAIGVRETGFRNILEPPPGNGAGVFQIDLGQNPDVTQDAAKELEWSAEFVAARLEENRESLSADFGNLSPMDLTNATLASYNHGLGGVTSDLNAGLSYDAHTTGKNYGSNISDLATCF